MPVILNQGTSLGCQGTYSFTDVMTVVKDFVHQIPTATSQVYVCHQINAMIHKAFPWRWTRFQFANINLVDGHQDYTSVPTNFYRLIEARIARTDISPPQYQPIKISKHVEREVQLKGSINSIQQVSFEPEFLAFRLDRAASVTGTATYQLQGEYQSQPTKITQLSQFLCPPDDYFNVTVEGVLWKFYQLADDPRAGTVGINRSGDKQTAGQYGVFRDALEEMKRMEDNDDGMQTRYPESPLGWSRAGSPGLFGW